LRHRFSCLLACNDKKKRGVYGLKLSSSFLSSKNRFRTGKNRPKELFVGAKRTCSLSHIRLGSAQNKKTNIKVFGCPKDLTWSELELQLEDVRDVFQDCLFALGAVPEVSEIFRRLATYPPL
jgi:hypothetical protein